MAGVREGEQSGIEAIRQMYESGFSIPEISELTGSPVPTLRNRLLRAGVKLRSRKEGVLNAIRRGRWFTSGSTKPRSDEAKQRMSEAKRAWAEQQSVGVRINGNGYAEFTRGPLKHRSVHTVVMETMLGRRLAGHEHVHHIDSDKLNNHPDNLALMTVSGHIRLHRLQDEMQGIQRERNKDGTWS